MWHMWFPWWLISSGLRGSLSYTYDVFGAVCGAACYFKKVFLTWHLLFASFYLFVWCILWGLQLCVLSNPWPYTCQDIALPLNHTLCPSICVFGLFLDQSLSYVWSDTACIYILFFQSSHPNMYSMYFSGCFVVFTNIYSLLTFICRVL